MRRALIAAGILIFLMGAVVFMTPGRAASAADNLTLVYFYTDG
jgi:hypothetical protein